MSDSPFYVDHLPNGLTLLGQFMPEVQSAAACFSVNTGARDEPRALSGISHFLEHMVFKGTATRSSEDINREFEEMGAENNAGTSWEYTIYYARVLKDRVPACISLLADMMYPRLDAADFDLERNVILEEIARYEDVPSRKLVWHIFERYFGDHPLASNIIGTPATLNAMTVEDMRGYWQRRYAANNIIFSIAGNFEWDTVREHVARLTADWRQGEAGRTITAPQVHSLTDAMVDERLQQEYIYLLMPGISREDPDRFVADVLTTILGDDTGSRLSWAVRETGLAESVGAGLAPFLGTGMVMASLVTSPEKAPVALAAVRSELRKLQDGGVEEDELVQAKVKLATAHVLEGESPSSRMNSLVDDWIALGKLETLHERVAAINAVTASDCRRLLDRFPLTTVQVLGTLGPLTEHNL